MTDDDFTRAARKRAEQRVPLDGGEPDLIFRDRRELVEMAEWARDHLAAQEPDVQHLWRPGASPRAFCGDESARPRVPVPVTRDESVAVPVCALCHQRAMHESYNHWATQEPTDAEAIAYLNAFVEDLPPGAGDDWTPDTIARVKRGLRAARRDEEKR